MIRIDLDAGEVRRLGLTLHNQSLSGRFGELICAAAVQAGQRAVVLVGEYDKPILADRETAAVMRDTLRSFYSVLKSADADLRFVLLTGVSKFSKVSLFSGLNQLQDITRDARWNALCGYTDADIDTVFALELPGLDRDEICHFQKATARNIKSRPHGLF
ncbi:MAG: AAA family ATPase [Sphaerotilus sulfidivorans]|uniref:AAA family ATPase n=1 Tax=Sphaerotilus sulfidivorans TaxID=639200 RepID=UPI003F405DAE